MAKDPVEQLTQDAERQKGERTQTPSITRSEAHQNAGTNANAPLFCSRKHADPGIHSSIPSGEAKTRTSPTNENGDVGTGAERATALKQGPLMAPGARQRIRFHWKGYLAHILMSAGTDKSHKSSRELD